MMCDPIIGDSGRENEKTEVLEDILKGRKILFEEYQIRKNERKMIKAKFLAYSEGSCLTVLSSIIF